MKKAMRRLKRMAGITALFVLVVFHQQTMEELEKAMGDVSGEKQAVSGKITLFSDDSPVEQKKTAYLTFDDGPSANTDKILDILKEKGVKATFFVVGKEGKQAKERYRRIVAEGHSLGMHSYSHRYEEIYGSMEGFIEDLTRLQNYLLEVTGQKVMIYRFPGGSSNSVSKIPMEDCISYLKEQGIEYYDWNASSEDAVLMDAACTVLNQNILKDALSYKRSVILMHDLLTCTETVEGLESLIDRLKEEGYEMKAITGDTVPVHHR